MHPNEFSSWKAPLEGEAAEVFGPRAGNGAVLAVVDVKSLHAKIGEDSMTKPAKRAKAKSAAKANTALGELNSEKKAPADPRSDSEKTAQRDSDDSESTR